MIKYVSILLLGVGLGGLATAFGPQLLHSATQPYAGQNERPISSLSAKDVSALEKGEGWGLAKPAEFNGYPGPAHVLEFADKLDLEQAQRAAIDSAFADMQANAKKLGVQLIEAERALDAAFQSNAIDDAMLKARLEQSSAIRAQLRQVHLAAHLKITPLLSDAQKERYAQLRGYGDGHSGHDGH